MIGAAERTGLPAVQPLRMSIFGCRLGRARYGAALARTPETEVVGLADDDLAAARAWAKEMGVKVPVVSDLAALLTPTPPDALLIAVPLRGRLEAIAAALRAGLPVLSEVPFAAALTETDSLLQLAGSGRLFPALSRRFDPAFQVVAARIANGVLGTIRQVRCDWSFPVGGATALEGGEAGAEFRALLQHIACQTADICRWWLGDALTVSADIDLPQRLPSRSAGGHLRDAAFANLIVAHARGQSTHHLIQSRAQLPGERYAITGTLGRLELIVSAGERAASSAPSLKLHLTGSRPETIPLPEETPEHGLSPASARVQRLLKHFVACARAQEPPRVCAEDAFAADEIVQAAFLSAQEGVKVTLPLHRPVDTATLESRPDSPPA